MLKAILPQIQAYTIAATAVAIALLLSLGLGDFIAQGIYLPFLAAVTFSCRYGGLKPGLFTLFLSALVSHYCLISLGYTALIPTVTGAIGLIGFVLIGLMICLLNEQLQSTKQRLLYTNQLLEQEIQGRKQAQQGLQECEAQLLATFDRVAVGIGHFDRDGKCLRLNQQYCDLVGYTRAELLQLSFLNITHPDDQQVSVKLSQQLWRGEVPYYSIEKRYIHKNGSLVWVNVIVSMVRDPLGVPKYVVAVVEDISIRKQAEDALRQRVLREQLVGTMQERIRSSLKLEEVLTTAVEEVRRFLETDRTIIYRFNSDWSGKVVVESVGEGWMSLLGKEFLDTGLVNRVAIFQQGEIEAIENIHTADFHPDHVDSLTQFQVTAELILPILQDNVEFSSLENSTQNTLWEGQSPTKFKVPFGKGKALQNSKLWGLLIAHHCQTPREWYSCEIESLRQLSVQLGIAIQQSTLYEQAQTEIAERQKAEEAWQESQRTLSTLMSNLPGMAYRCLKDWNWTMKFVSEGCYDLTGYQPQELIDNTKLSYIQIIHPEDRQQVWNEVQAAATACRPFQLIYRIITATGQLKWVWEQGQEVSCHQDQQTSLEGFITDITDRKQAEEALRERENRLLRQQAAQIQLVKQRKLYTGDLNAALSLITETASHTIDVERASIWFYNRSHSAISCADLYQLTDTTHSSGIELFAADYPAYFQELEADRVIAANQAQIDPRTQEFTPNYLIPLGITSMLDVPIRSGGQTVGVICLEHTGFSRTWNLEEQNFASYLADMVALAIEARERKQAEEALRESEEKFRSLVSNIPGAFYRCTCDADRTMVLISEEIAVISGYPASDYVNNKVRTYSSIIHPEDRERVIIAVNKAVAVKQPFSLEYRVIHANGDIRWVYEKGQGTFSADVSWLDGAIFDISERKRAEQALHDKNQELATTLQQLQATQQELIQSEKMAALGQLIAGVAHEINTPLGAIRSSVENIADFFGENLAEIPRFFQQISSERQQDFFALLYQSTQQKALFSTKEKRQLKRALKTQLNEQGVDNIDTIADLLIDIGIYHETDQLLPFLKASDSRLILNWVYQIASLQKSIKTITTATDRAAKVVFALRTYTHHSSTDEKLQTNIVEGIETVLTLYQNLLKQGVEVVRNYEIPLPLVSCYPDELNQVWTNLIHNALQAMNNQGDLKIDVKSQDGWMQVSITDSGEGIPPEILSRIFEPFFTTKSPGEGSGLGLDIVKKIIDKHKGTIEVQSVPKETTFTVSIPIGVE